MLEIEAICATDVRLTEATEIPLNTEWTLATEATDRELMATCEALLTTERADCSDAALRTDKTLCVDRTDARPAVQGPCFHQ